MLAAKRRDAGPAPARYLSLGFYVDDIWILNSTPAEGTEEALNDKSQFAQDAAQHKEAADTEVAEVGTETVKGVPEWFNELVHRVGGDVVIDTIGEFQRRRDADSG